MREHFECFECLHVQYEYSNQHKGEKNSNRVAGSCRSVIGPLWSLCGGSISQLGWENVPRKQVELVFKQKTNC